MKKIKVLFIMAIASIFMLTACSQRDDYGSYEYLEAFKYEYKYDEKEEGYTLFISQPRYRENASNRNPIEFSKDLVPFGQEELVLPSYYEGKPIVRMNVDILYGSILNQDKKIKHIVLPQKIKEIEEYAFSGCSSLTSITIPESVKEIGKYAFSYCSSLTSISIPSSVTEIGARAFYGCRSLTSIKVDKNNLVYDSRYNCNAIIESKSNKLIMGCAKTVIPTSVKIIGEDAFSGCISLTSISIPSSVTKIGKEAFYGCISLTSISIPSSVAEIGEDAFFHCKSLTNLEILNGVKTIGYEAFSGCISLTNLEIPDGMETIENHAFSDCSSLTSISIPSSVTKIGERVFSGCSSLTSISIPSSVTEIGSEAFSGCSSLKSIRISGMLDYVGNQIFKDCNALETIELSVFVGIPNISTYFTYPDLNVYIFYSGTIKEFGEKFDFYETGKYIIHCSDGDINVGYWRAK